MRFGERLARERWVPWAGQYINFELLKRKIKECTRAADAHDLEEGKDEFERELDAEIEKVLSFYKEKSGAAKAHAVEAKARSQQAINAAQAASGAAPIDAALAAIDEALRGLRPVAMDVLHLLGFVSLNMAAIRKILKKYAKNVAPNKPQPGYLTLRVEHPHEPGWKVLQGTFLKEAVGADLEAMGNHTALNSASDKIREVYEHLRYARETLFTKRAALPTTPDQGVPAPAAAAEEAKKALRALPADTTALRKSYSRKPTLSSFKYTPAWVPGLMEEAPEELDLDELLQQLRFALEMADRNARLIHPIPWQEAQAGIFEPPPPDEEAIATQGGLLLNCINSGLYMANYNLIIPTITELCAHIGVPNSTVGIIIGCCDIATIPATMGYSVWTNSNYKYPLIASGLACLLGNLAYCLSYDWNAVWLLFIARLITGFGSARTVNRRYIASFVARKDRTSASALFVSLSAVGMALGPLLALPLARFPTLRFAGLTFDHITMGGWIMSGAWIIFMVCAWFGFDDPLAVRRAKEAAAALQEPLLTNGANGAVDEEAPLLQAGKVAAPASSAADEDDDEEDADDGFGARLSHLWSSPAMATACCIFLCFILKVVQQAYIDGLPIFTQVAYGWSNGEVGIMLGVLGLVAPLVNFTVGHISANVPDRHITAASIVVAGAGSFALMKGTYPQANFFIAGPLVYMGTIVLEAVSMSLTSKVVDERLAQGLWNAGLLSTQAGTIGRLCGNLLLSACARVTGAMAQGQIDSLARLMWGVAAGSMVFSLAYVASLYGRLLG